MGSDQILHFWGRRLKMLVEDAAGKIYPLRKTVPCEGGQFSPEGQPETTEYHVLKDFVRVYSADNVPPLLVFGDSVSLRVATDDRSPQSLGEILRAHYQDHVCLISGSGYHAGIFEYFGAVLAAMRSRPRLAILPINPRSFSPTWDLNPLYQFRSEVELLASFNANRPNYRLREAKICSEVDELLAPLVLSHEETITLSEFLDLISVNLVVGSDEWRKRLKTIFQCHYMLPVSSLERSLLKAGYFNLLYFDCFYNGQRT